MSDFSRQLSIWVISSLLLLGIAAWVFYTRHQGGGSMPETISASVNQSLSALREHKVQVIYLELPEAWQADVRKLFSDPDTQRATALGQQIADVIQNQSQFVENSFVFQTPGSVPTDARATLRTIADFFLVARALSVASGNQQRFLDELTRLDLKSPPLVLRGALLLRQLAITPPDLPEKIEVESIENDAAIAQAYFSNGRTEPCKLVFQNGKWLPVDWGKRWQSLMRFLQERLHRVSKLSKDEALQNTLDKMRTATTQAEFDDLLRTFLDQALAQTGSS